MKNINEKRYPNVDEAVAFEIAFAQMVYAYGDQGAEDMFDECPKCWNRKEQTDDFLAPKSACEKFDGAILDVLYYGVSEKVKNDLIEKFDITEDDFRPCRNKTGDIVFYQIAPTHTMLPLAGPLKYRLLKPCPVCGAAQYRRKEYKNKDGWEYNYITQEALDDLHDLNVTYEHFHRYYPEWVVSRRVFEYFSENYPRLVFRPLFLKKKR